MRISDWSSDVCSSDLRPANQSLKPTFTRIRYVHAAYLQCYAASGLLTWCQLPRLLSDCRHAGRSMRAPLHARHSAGVLRPLDRKSVVSGKSVSVRLDIGGSRIITQNKNAKQTNIRQKKK